MSYESDENAGDSVDTPDDALDGAPEVQGNVCDVCGVHRQVESTRVRRRGPSVVVLVCGHREEL